VQVNTGIIDANPSTSAGVIDIMSQLNNFVTKIHNDNDSLVVIPVHGDCSAVKRMVDGQRARAAKLTALDRH